MSKWCAPHATREGVAALLRSHVRPRQRWTATDRRRVRVPPHDKVARFVVASPGCLSPMFRLGRTALGLHAFAAPRMRVPCTPLRFARSASTDELSRARHLQQQLRAQDIRKRNQSIVMYTASGVRGPQESHHSSLSSCLVCATRQSPCTAPSAPRRVTVARP